MSAPVPPDKSIRSLIIGPYEILNTPPEPAYDDIVKLATLICDVPVALICFVDRDRFWFKAKVGLDIFEVPCEATPCSYVLDHSDEILVATDITKDGRVTATARQALLDQDLRFYAGAPLVTPDGHTVGTICVFDTAPRSFAAEKAQALAVLARQVMAMLELRRHVAVLRDANNKLAASSMTDSLTGLPNAVAFDRRLLAEGARALRTDHPMSLLLLQIDDFGRYRAEFGDVAADNAFYAVAHTLSQNARPYDYVARYNAELFAVILPGLTKSDAVQVAERLCKAVAELPVSYRALRLLVGMSHITPDSDSASMLLSATMDLHKAQIGPR